MYLIDREQNIITNNTKETVEFVLNLPKLLIEYFRNIQGLSNSDRLKLDDDIFLIINYINDFTFDDLTPLSCREIIPLVEKYFNQGWRIKNGISEQMGIRWGGK